MEMEPVVRLRRSRNYLAFPQYREDGTVTSTILPAMLLPTNMTRFKQDSRAKVHFPLINVTEKAERLPFHRKKTPHSKGTTLPSVQELTIPTPPPELRTSARRSKTKKHHAPEDEKMDGGLPPKIILSHSDESNFSVKNIYEPRPGNDQIYIFFNAVLFYVQPFFVLCVVMF